MKIPNDEFFFRLQNNIYSIEWDNKNAISYFFFSIRKLYTYFILYITRRNIKKKIYNEKYVRLSKDLKAIFSSSFAIFSKIPREIEKL